MCPVKQQKYTSPFVILVCAVKTEALFKMRCQFSKLCTKLFMLVKYGSDL